MDQLDPEVDVAVLLDPDRGALVNPVRPVVPRETRWGRAIVQVMVLIGVRQGQSWRRTSTGQFDGSKPWCRKSARVTRSRPKPRHAVWAVAPSAV